MGSSSPARPPKRATESATEMTEYVLPTHANALGNVFGGQVMAWMDLCAAICAQRHSGRVCVTAAIDDLCFEQPIGVGQVVRLKATVTAAFRTSLEIHVDSWGEDPTTGRTWPCVSAYLTFVALDGSKPTTVPGLDVVTAEERSRQQAAEERRRRRLERRSTTP